MIKNLYMYIFTNTRDITHKATLRVPRITHFHINKSASSHSDTNDIYVWEMVFMEVSLLGRVSPSLCFFFTISSKNICPSTEEPSGGERTGLTAKMAPVSSPLPPHSVLLLLSLQKKKRHFHS